MRPRTIAPSSSFRCHTAIPAPSCPPQHRLFVCLVIFLWCHPPPAHPCPLPTLGQPHDDAGLERSRLKDYEIPPKIGNDRLKDCRQRRWRGKVDDPLGCPGDLDCGARSLESLSFSLSRRRFRDKLLLFLLSTCLFYFRSLRFIRLRYPRSYDEWALQNESFVL